MKNIKRKQSSALVRLLVLCLLAVPVFVSGCDYASNALKHDRSSSLEAQDYRDSLAPRLPDVDDSKPGQALIPDLQPYVSAPLQDQEVMPLVSLSVNQSIPLRDVLFELASQAEYDLELDPEIRGSIIFTARERPFDEVIQRISDIAGLRYKFDNNVLRVEQDKPYSKTYKVDYLSYIRSSSSSVRNDIAVVSGDGADTGSTFEASSVSEVDFWGELENNLEQILLANVPRRLANVRNPRITATPQNPDVRPVAPTADESGQLVQVQPPDAVLNVESLPLDDDFGSGNNDDDDEPEQSFSINRQAGLINIFATDKAQKHVQEYLNVLRRSITAQVLIEAKILEVSLTDEFATGIDWRAIDVFNGELALNYLTGDGVTRLLGAGPNSLPTIGTASGANQSGVVVGYAGHDVQALVEAISGFGSVKALASPRLTVINNQSAVLNVATNQVFFEIDIDTTTEDGVTQVDIDSDIRNVPEGVLVNVQPSIDLDSDVVSLALRPTITRIVNEVSDPAVEFISASSGAGNIVSLVPELNVQEIDTVIQVRSGQPIVLGGLLQDRTESTQEGIPGISEVPMVGSLFKQRSDSISKTELVILLKATILENPSRTIHNTDRDLYRQFSGDRRPFKL